MHYSTMMKACAFVFATLLSYGHAAPAVVWRSSESGNNNERFLHSSEDLSASRLLNNVLSETPEAPLSTVIFLVGKGHDGSEQLSELASSGKLPQTFAKYNDAAGVYHHVSGLESTGSIVREAGRATDANRVLEVSLHEFSSKLSSVGAPVEIEIDSAGTTQSSSKSVNKRARALSRADILVVNVNSKQDASEIDSYVTSAIESKNVGNVVLAGIRSVDEVKHERFLMHKRRMLIMEKAGNKVIGSRRRLEQEAAGDDAAEQDASDDMAGVYYVAMTPNIFSGILFFLMFIVVTYTGISCMGDIQGGEVFVSKYPSLGREA